MASTLVIGYRTISDGWAGLSRVVRVLAYVLTASTAVAISDVKRILELSLMEVTRRFGNECLLCFVDDSRPLRLEKP